MINIPYDNEDAPAIGQKQMTLGEYTTHIDVSNELLEDTATKIMAFLANFVGRRMAKTNNGLLLTEVATNGKSSKPLHRRQRLPLASRKTLFPATIWRLILKMIWAMLSLCGVRSTGNF